MNVTKANPKRVQVCIVNDIFLRERALQLREIATKADPFTKKRLLALASRYEGNTIKRETPLPMVPMADISKPVSD